MTAIENLAEEIKAGADRLLDEVALTCESNPQLALAQLMLAVISLANAVGMTEVQFREAFEGSLKTWGYKKGTQ